MKPSFFWKAPLTYLVSHRKVTTEAVLSDLVFTKSFLPKKIFKWKEMIFFPSRLHIDTAVVECTIQILRNLNTGNLERKKARFNRKHKTHFESDAVYHTHRTQSKPN